MGGQPYQPADLGAPIHTALRKCCDSTLSSMVHSLVSGLGDEWLLFLRAIHNGITNKTIDTSSRGLMAATMGAWLEVTWQLDKVLDRDEWDALTRKDDGRTRSRFHALCFAFRLLHESGELTGALHFCFDEES